MPARAEGGEEASARFADADGRQRRFASSLTATLEKVRGDAVRLHERQAKFDELFFVAPVPVSPLQVSS